MPPTERLSASKPALKQVAFPLLCPCLAAVLAGCGSNPDSAIEALFPRNETVVGWTVDQSDENSVARNKIAAVATSETQAEVDLQLGSAVAPFYAGYSPTRLALQRYVNPNLGGTVVVYVVEMPAADQAAALYASLASDSLYAASTWQDPAGVDGAQASRIADTGAVWWVNFYAGVYYGELELHPSGGDVTTQAYALDFARAIVSKI